jgi:uncharacterized protein YfaP (DUF2135 family)
VNGIKLTVSWSDTQTEIQAHLTSPQGFVLASSEYPTSSYVSSGKFDWHTSTGGPAEAISALNISPGVYLLVLHNTLFGGSFLNYPENFTLSVEMT